MVRLGECTLSYVYLSKPYDNPDRPEGRPRYSATLLIPKTNTQAKAAVESAMREAYEEGVQKKWNGARPQMAHALIYDGDGVKTDGTPFGPECAGCWVMTASNTRKPNILDVKTGGVITDPAELYSGMYADVIVSFYAYANGSRGVACNFECAVKTRDGEPLSGGVVSAATARGLFADLLPAGAGMLGAVNPAAAQGQQATDAVQAQQTGPVNPFTGLPM